MPVCICPAHDHRYRMQSGIIDLVFLNKVVKGAFILIMRELHPRHIEWRSAQLCRFCSHFFEWHIDNLSLLIDKSLYYPAPSNTVNLGSLSPYPFPPLNISL